MWFSPTKYDRSKANQVSPKLHEIKAKWTITLNFTGSNREQNLVISPAVDVGHGPSIKTLHKHPWGHQNYFKPKQYYLVLAASGASDQDVWGIYECNFLWLFQWHHWRPCLKSTAREIVIFLLSLAAPHLHGVLVLVTGDNFSLVSLTLVITLLLVSTAPAITENPGATDSWKKPEVHNLVSDSP
jgi:hypothetical protein